MESEALRMGRGEWKWRVKHCEWGEGNGNGE